MNKPSHLAVGKILRPHGISGAIKIKLYNAQSEIFERQTPIFYGRDLNTLSPLEVVRANRLSQGDTYIVHTKSISTVDAAKAIGNWEIWVEMSHLPALAENEFYHHQLIGLEVIGSADELVGKVTGILTNRGADILQVEGNKREVLVPLIRDAIRKVDLHTGKIFLGELQGLGDEEV